MRVLDLSVARVHRLRLSPLPPPPLRLFPSRKFLQIIGTILASAREPRWKSRDRSSVPSETYDRSWPWRCDRCERTLTYGKRSYLDLFSSRIRFPSNRKRKVGIQGLSIPRVTISYSVRGLSNHARFFPPSPSARISWRTTTAEETCHCERMGQG